MVATIGQMASAEYYLESQRSFRHPNEYYTAGEEPDGTWFNPKSLFGLEDGQKVDSGHFHRLYSGFAPDGSGKLVQRAGNPERSPGVDLTFSVDKSVSSLWAIAEPEMRERIEAMAVASARAALEDTVLKHCSYTRVAEKGVTRPVEADLVGATFVHGTSRENDPQLHVHCTIFNLARTREDGKWRAHHQYPVYSWKKAAGALFRANMAWELQQNLGVRMEQYGRNAEFTRIEGMPEDLQSFWSKRRKAIVAKAGELGIPSLGNASRMAGVNKLTRQGKSHDNDPEVRHRRWRGEAEDYVEREELIASVTGHEVNIPREAIRELTDRLDDLPAHLAREEAVFRRPDMVEAAANAAAGLMGREAVGTAIERLRRNPEIERLEPKKPTAESRAGMVHTEVYSTRHNLGLEQAVRDMAEAMASDAGHGLPEEAVKEKVETLLADGYPLSQEQSLAIRHATVKGGRVAVIEGAAGSGKTTTLRPITDLHREHGYEIVPTAVAWRTAVALGDDCDARAYCVDKLLKLAAKEQVEIGKRTLIVVDEAGMLSTRQAHHILQLSERHGAKVVFAGDTRQQQPVEAGPGLRLIRDVAGSVRVDRIRRQKPDLEDVLVHVHKETPERARFRAGLTNRQERGAILAEYEAMDRKPVFTPWQVAVSEALRDGEAEKAIEAWHVRNRLHLCHDEEKTIARLVDDWVRHVRAQPDTSTVVLARTRAEARALSWLMRQRVLAQTPDAKRAVIEVSRDLDGRVTEPLEIAVGDRIRIGATQWEKQLFNGTVVTVEDLEVRPAESAAVSRKARNREAVGKDREVDADRHQPELSVHITARTDGGRRVTFRHDEIRDWHDNIRLDYGYAMTIASAQGLTVDRAFLLADDRPARETIYPAATRHREALDVYVNRSPLAFDIAEHRPEDEAERPVLDSDVRAYLAERWARSQPKEAALDYVSEGAWRDAREDARERRHRASSPTQEETASVAAHAAANDNALVRIAGEIRHAVNGWRHGAAVDAFAAERTEVLAAWDELRERARADGGAVALSPAFRETLDRHGALMKQAASFRARPQVFDRLLAERAGIGQDDLQELRDVHARAGSYLRSVTARTAHTARQEAAGKREAPRRDAEAEGEQVRQDAQRPPEDMRQDASAAEPTARPDRSDVQTRQDAGREAAPVPPAAEAPAPSKASMDLSQAAYRRLWRDWQAHLRRAESEGVHRFDLDGAGALVERIAAFAGKEELAAEPRAQLEEIVGQYRAHVEARDRVRGLLRDVERHWLRHGTISERARQLDVGRQELRSWPIWLERNERLLQAARAILDDPATYGPHLDRIGDGRERLLGEVSKMERFALRWETLYDRLERDWSDLVARANRAGLRLPLVGGYDELIGRVRDLAGHPQLPSTEREELTGLLDYHRAETAARGAVHGYLEAAERHVEAFKALERQAGEQGVAVADLAGWPDWRREARRLEKAGRAILADEDTYGAYLDAVAAGKPRASLTVDQLRSRLRDNRSRAPKAAASQPRQERSPEQEEGFAHRLDKPREPGKQAGREDEKQGIAWILDDPEKLRELREQHEKRERKLGRHLRRSRGRSM